MKRDAPTLEIIIRDADFEACAQFFLESTAAERAGVRMLVEELTPWVIQREKDSVNAMLGRTKKLASSSEPKEKRITAVNRCRVLGLCILATGTLSQ